MSKFKSLTLKLKEKLEYTPSEVELISSGAISQNMIDDIREVFGDHVVIKQIINHKIVGGVQLKVGDLLLDASIENRIDHLESSLTAGNNDEPKSVFEHIKDRIESFDPQIETSEVGEVITSKDGICQISGLTHCMYQEVLEFMNGAKALAMNLDRETVGAVILGEFKDVKAGDIVKRTGKVMSINVGEELIGRVINPLGEAIDGGSALNLEESYQVERVAPGVMTRKPVDKPLQTGIKAIDSIIPIGKGQRELILGDRQTGKTTIAIDTIINQKDSDVICIYVAIGQKESKVANLVSVLEKSGAMDYTIVVNASASSPAAMLYLAPYSGVTIAEYFAERGKDVLVIYDDLTKHAVAYREMSLLLRRPPGREAYPGDVFYLHSRLLERAASLNEEHGGGSITALPIIETQAGDISAYVPTNVISITDGQIFLETDLFYRGIRPAINVGLSVSRVGGAAQTKPMKKVAGKVKMSLAQFRELEDFAQFASDLDPKTKKQIERGKRIVEVLKQKNYKPVNVVDQVLVMFAVNNGYFDEFDVDQMAKHESNLIDFVRGTEPELVNRLKVGEWEDDLKEKLQKSCEDYVISTKSTNAEE